MNSNKKADRHALPSRSPCTVDAVFAVYEASSFELWYFMELTALNGAPRDGITIFLFFTTMVVYLVILIQVSTRLYHHTYTLLNPPFYTTTHTHTQQSVFLVVIIESFAGLRSESTIGSSPKPKNKPRVVSC